MNIEGVKMAYYEKKDWPRFLGMADDREILEDTWEEWHEEYKKGVEGFKSIGMTVIKVPIDLDELDRYCKKQGLKNDAAARSQYAVEK